MLSVADAQSRILALVKPLGGEMLSLSASAGRYLAETPMARRTQPPVAVSSMDGYAVRRQDIQGVGSTLTLIGQSAAGDGFDGAVGVGEAVRIFTGAPVPDGTDCIVIQENVSAGGTGIEITAEPDEGFKAGAFIRPAGLDFKEGTAPDSLSPGKRLSARDLALLAAMDLPWLRVARRPRVAILATGDEISFPGEPRGKSQIIGASGFAIAPMLEATNAEVIDLGVARDDMEALQDAFATARGADLLITMGGVSVGAPDLVQDALNRHGGDEGAFALDFWRIAMRPGKPLMTGRLSGMPVIGLPGNPVSSIVCTLLFVLPAIRVMQGDPAPLPETARVRLGSALPDNGVRADYIRAQLRREGGEFTALPHPVQDSSMLAVLADSDALIIRPPHAVAAAPGEHVEILRLD